MASIRLHQLEGFFHVARQGNYTRAAAAYSYPIGQPAVYQQVKGLQHDMGVTLVRQAGPRRTELTPEGRALYAFVAPFFDGLPRVVEDLKDGPIEPLLLAVDQFLAMEALPSALRMTNRLHPDFSVRMQELSTKAIEEEVESGRADAGLYHPRRLPASLRWEPLGRIGVALLIPKGHPLAKLKRIPTPKELVKHPLVVYGPSSPGRMLMERLFRDAGGKLKVAAEVIFSQTMCALASSGVAPAFVPFLLPGQKGNQSEGLPKYPNTVCFDVSNRLQGGALPFGLIYRSGAEASRTFQALSLSLRKLWG